MKWWKKLHWRIIDISILNASICFSNKKNPDSNIKAKLSLSAGIDNELVQAMLKTPTSYHAVRTPGQVISHLKGKHFPHRDTNKRGKMCCMFEHQKYGTEEK